MNTEPCRGFRAKMPIIDDAFLMSLDDIYEIIYESNNKKIINIVGDTLCIE